MVNLICVVFPSIVYLLIVWKLFPPNEWADDALVSPKVYILPAKGPFVP